MKKRLYISIIALTATLLSACNGMLTEESKVDISKEKYFSNATDAQHVLLGVYRNMTSDDIYAYNLSCLFDMSTDLSQTADANATSWREIPANAFNASNSSVLNTWKSLYAAIYDANDFIEMAHSRIGSFTPEDIAKTKIYICEAKALRALYYFELVRWFGNIPLITSTKQAYQDPSTFTQQDPVDIYKYIESDLKEAINTLPWSTDNISNTSNEFRLSRGAAMGLLAKVYATWAGAPIKDESKWKLAASTAGALCNSGKHSLNPSFTKLWENTCNGIWEPNESLIEVSFYAPIITGTASQDPAGRIGKWNGVVADDIPGLRARNAGNVKVIHTFFLEWKNTQPNDLRRSISVANYQYRPNKMLLVKGNNPAATYTDEMAAIDDADPTKKQKEKQSYTPAKWDTEKYVLKGNKLLDADKSNVNWYVLRYADVLLLYAEALNEVQGPTGDALEAINMVRRRGYGLDARTPDNTVDIQNTLSQEQLRQVIRQERAYELCFEGTRRQDLVRWGVYYQTIRQTASNLSTWYDAANYVANEFTVKGKHELFPIPQRELDMMKQVKQNPKW